MKLTVGENIDILLIWNQIKWELSRGPVPYERIPSTKGGGGWIVKVDIPCRRIPVNFTPYIEAMVIEINLKKRKWLLLGIYNPYKDMTTTCLRSIALKLDELSLKYENII